MEMEPLPLGFGDAMDATLFSSLWTFQDQVVQPQETAEELKQSLLTATVELEASKEELRRKDQTIGKLADLVRQVAKERDEALDRAQHLALLAKQQAPPPAALVTSSVTDSDCSLVSSPVDPFFDPVTSSDRSRCGGGGKLSPPPPAKQQKQCGADAVLDMLAGKRPLPPRGRFLQSVMEAGPLLQNLLVAGPLPRWRNPPPMHALPVGGGVYLSATPLHTANALGICSRRRGLREEHLQPLPRPSSPARPNRLVGVMRFMGLAQPARLSNMATYLDRRVRSGSSVHQIWATVVSGRIAGVSSRGTKGPHHSDPTTFFH